MVRISIRHEASTGSTIDGQHPAKPLHKANSGSSSQENAGEEVADEAEEEKPKQRQRGHRFVEVFCTETKTHLLKIENPATA